MGGLTAAYAASKHPKVFRRGLAMSPTNCFNWASGGLADTIATNFAAAGNVLPRFVMQVFGGEIYSQQWTDHDGNGPYNQLDFMLREQAAWEAVGMETLRWGPVRETAPNQTAAEAEAAGGEFGQFRAPHAFSTLPLGELGSGKGQIASMVLPGGQHSPGTWEREFSWSLRYLYRAGGWEGHANAHRVPVSAVLQDFSGSASASPHPQQQSPASGQALRVGAAQGPGAAHEASSLEVGHGTLLAMLASAAAAGGLIARWI